MYKNRLILFAVTALVLSSLACRFSIDLPVEKVTTGPVQTEAIEIPLPQAEPARLTVAFGAGELNIQPGAEGALVTGEAAYNVADFKPKVSEQDGEILLETGNLNLNGIPSFDDNVENTWDLALSDMPMHLKLSAGAYKGDYELGGLSLLSLAVSDGAAEVRMDFSEPNPVEMEGFTYTTGASNVHLRGLANANTTEMSLKSGAGAYSLDFSGELKRDLNVRIDSGMSNVTIIVPEGVSARVVMDSQMVGINTSGGWVKSDGGYTLAGSGPTITITVNLTAGGLELKTQE